MNYGDNPQLDRLVDDGKLMEQLRRTPCALCGHVTEDGYWPIIRSGQPYCNNCWHNARNLIPNT